MCYNVSNTAHTIILNNSIFSASAVHNKYGCSDVTCSNTWKIKYEKINIWCLINEYNNSCATMKNGIIDSNYLFLLSNIYTIQYNIFIPIRVPQGAITNIHS
jgi:hypothetical protein